MAASARIRMPQVHAWLYPPLLPPLRAEAGCAGKLTRAQRWRLKIYHWCSSHNAVWIHAFVGLEVIIMVPDVWHVFRHSHTARLQHVLSKYCCKVGRSRMVDIYAALEVRHINCIEAHKGDE
jgi:hypothetical protein